MSTSIMSFYCFPVVTPALLQHKQQDVTWCPCSLANVVHFVFVIFRALSSILLINFCLQYFITQFITHTLGDKQSLCIFSSKVFRECLKSLISQGWRSLIINDNLKSRWRLQFNHDLCRYLCEINLNLEIKPDFYSMLLENPPINDECQKSLVVVQS